MIDSLNIAKSANFFMQRKRLTDRAIVDLFRLVRQHATAPTQNLFRHERERLNGARWSAISFFYDRDPSFLSPAPANKERICGFILIVEFDHKIAVFKSGIELPSTFKTEYLERIDHSKVESALAYGEAIFEKIRLRNMSTSKHVLRSKVLESSDLQNAVGPSGASRFIPQSYSLRRDDGYYSTTPNTGRIAHRSDKVGYEDLIRWSIAIMGELGHQRADISPFIRTFARPVDLASMANTLKPTYFAVNAASLVEILLENEDLRLVRQIGVAFVELTNEEAAAVIATLDVSLVIRKTRDGFRLFSEGVRAPVGKIKISRSRIALQQLFIADIAMLFVERTSSPIGEDEDRIALRSYIDRNDQFIILFEDLTLAYFDGSVYRDELLAAGGGNLLRYLQTDVRLSQSTSEKGDLVNGQVNFDNESVFDVVVSSIAQQDDVLLCDDLGDEWADFIGLNTTSNPKTISFYHAKYGDVSLGASSFHVSISQAIKNLGRLSLPVDEMGRKIDSWSEPYTNFGVTSAIPRIMRGDRAQLGTVLAETRATPDTVSRVFIVTSSLSKSQVEQTFARMRAGRAPPPHFIQLYWLLLSFFSACSEVGAFGRIICQE